MISSVQSLSHVRLFATPWTAVYQASLSVTNSWSLLKLMSINLVMLFNHLILWCPLLLLPLIFPSIRVFFNETVLRIRCSNYWSFSISTCNEYSGFISFRIEWFDLLAVQGTIERLISASLSSQSHFLHSLCSFKMFLFLFFAILHVYLPFRLTVSWIHTLFLCLIYLHILWHSTVSTGWATAK